MSSSLTRVYACTLDLTSIRKCQAFAIICYELKQHSSFEVHYSIKLRALEACFDCELATLREALPVDGVCLSLRVVEGM